MRPDTRVSTVTAAAASYLLADLAGVKTRLAITGTGSDQVLTRFIADASAAAIRFMNNRIALETLTDRIWPWRDSWLGALRDSLPVLQLSRWPIVSVTSVTETVGGAAVTLTQDVDFLIDPDPGHLIRLNSCGAPRAWSASAVAVVYTAGYATIPSDIQEAVSEMVKARFFAQSRDPLVRSENVEGVMQTSYWSGAGPGADTDMPPAIQAKLERYRPSLFR